LSICQQVWAGNDSSIRNRQREMRTNMGYMSSGFGALAGLDSRRGLLDDAVSILAVHSATADGTCAGCWAGIQRPVAAPCPVARRWLAVVETHGVTEWDGLGTGAVICQGCGGRGWKFVTSRVAGLWSDCLVGLIRRSCIDCTGEGVVRHG
jgi:hypothetical protein